MAKDPGNLLVIMSDEHQARAMGCAGHAFVQTPNLDALAARGTRFSNAYTPCPICVPARASFATGRRVNDLRLWDNAMPYCGEPKGWGHALQDAGIRVDSIGKLHYRAEVDPNGFDTEHIPMMVKDGVGMIWASLRSVEERWSPSSRMLGDYIGPGESPYTRYDNSVTERACEWLQERAGDPEPWCLFVGLVAPHFPLVVPTEYFDLYPAKDLLQAKLQPRDGYARHPWVELQNAFMDSESNFRDETERLAAMSAYYGLCTWLDRNVGQILTVLQQSGFGDSTVLYTSDHGDNVGARGLWGKSVLYEEATAIPMILSGPNIPAGHVCDTPTDLLDAAETILRHFDVSLPGARPGTPMQKLIDAPLDPHRVIFSEYHAAGAVSGAYMVRKGRWKLHYYVGFDPELFDLQDDPEELVDLWPQRKHDAVFRELMDELKRIVDPEEADATAHADQRQLVEEIGGMEIAKSIGPRGATPPPEQQ